MGNQLAACSDSEWHTDRNGRASLDWTFVPGEADAPAALDLLGAALRTVHDPATYESIDVTARAPD